MKLSENNLKKLESWCDGSFAILILGESGTGKSTLLKNFVGYEVVSEQNLEHSSKYRTKSIDCKSIFWSELKGNDKKDLHQFFDQDQFDIIFFDHLDFLPFEKQVELFDLLSTNSKGESIITQKKLPQIIGTLSTPMVQLYGNPNWLDPLLDRFAQQIIIMDPLRNFTKDRLYTEIKRTWEFMKFKDVSENFEEVYPEDKAAQIRDWLFSIKSTLRGNYRDLDVIAIHLWRGEMEKMPLEDILANLDFILGTLRNNPDHAFRVGIEADIMIKDFRKELIQWAEKVYPDTATLLNTLKISEKTAYNWKNLK